MRPSRLSDEEPERGTSEGPSATIKIVGYEDGEGEEATRLSEAYYWCLDHEQVEGEDGCPNYRRMGPYATKQEAEGALDRARARTAEWDAQEQAEDAWGENGSAQR